MSFQRIKIAEARPLVENSTAKIVDIRDAMSYTSGHITGAVHVTNDNIKEFMNSAPVNTPLLVCCYHGNSSQGAAQFFADQGYEEVYSLDGGYEMWKLAIPELCSN